MNTQRVSFFFLLFNPIDLIDSNQLDMFNQENVRRVLQDGENAHPLLFSSSSSQKSSQSSSTTSSQQSQGLKASSLLNQGGLVKTTGLSQSKKINLSSQLKPLNEGRKILTDKSNKGILLSSASSSESSSKVP